MEFKIKICKAEKIPVDPSYGGFYIDGRGKEFLLTHPHAITLQHMDSLPSFEEKFAFFCYAFLRSFFNYWYFKKDFNSVGKEYDALYKKFGYIWNGNVHHALPAITDGLVLPNDKIITKTGLNKELLMKEFKKYSEYEFFLYH